MCAMVSQITSRIIVIQLFIQAQVKETIRTPHKRPVTRKMFPFDDGLMAPMTPYGVTKPQWGNMLLRETHHLDVINESSL